MIRYFALYVKHPCFVSTTLFAFSHLWVLHMFYPLPKITFPQNLSFTKFSSSLNRMHLFFKSKTDTAKIWITCHMLCLPPKKIRDTGSSSGAWITLNFLYQGARCGAVTACACTPLAHGPCVCAVGTGRPHSHEIPNTLSGPSLPKCSLTRASFYAVQKQVFPAYF